MNTMNKTETDNIFIPIIKTKPAQLAKVFPTCDYTMYFDGCSKGNPGHAGIGAVIYKNNDELWGGYKYIGLKTNNQSEYNALIFGLNQAIDYDIKELIVFGDSQLVINQVTDVYKVRNPLLLELYGEVCELKKQFRYIEFIHVYREKNKRADQLSNIALNMIIDDFIPIKTTKLPSIL